MRLWLTALLVLAAVAAPTVAAELRFSFDAGTDGWVKSPLDDGTTAVSVTTQRASAGAQSLAIGVRFPQSVGVTYYPMDDLTPYAELAFDLFIPRSAPDDLDLYVYLKDKEYHWYQTAPFKAPDTGFARGPIPRDRWLHVSLDISDQSRIWEPAGHMKVWHRSTYCPHELGLRFFSSASWEGTLYLDEVLLRSLGRRPAPGRREIQPPIAAPATPLPPAHQRAPALPCIRVSQSAASVPQYEKLELTFHLDRVYDNPFDPEEIDVRGHFSGPSGREIEVPGFFYQGYARMRDEKGNEQLTPVGAPCWKVRFAPKEQGKYRFFVTAKEGPPEWIRRRRPPAERERLLAGLTLRELKSAEGAFTATAPRDPRGYLRVSKRDPRYFEFENGDFYYVWGLNMRDGGDQAAAQQGTYDFDYYLPRMAAHGFNFVRTWMCAWWAGLEWSERYESRYYDAGRYAMYNAWRLDHALDLAAQQDLFVELTFNNHGQVRRDKFDQEWEYNPYAVRNGGFLSSPPQFFTDERAEELFRRRYRYIAARWGYSRHIMSWDLWNEVDLVEGYNEAETAAFNQRLARYMRSIDPWQHIISTHMCLYWFKGSDGRPHGSKMWRIPEMEIVKADSYWGNAKKAILQGPVCDDMSKVWNSGYGFNKNDLQKPFLFIEWGKQTQFGRFPTPRDLRVGLWVSYMQPGAGVGVFWHWDITDQKNWYHVWEALRRFDGGYDRRGKQLFNTTAPRPALPEAAADQQGYTTVRPPVLWCQTMQNDHEVYFYAFNWPNMKYEDPAAVPHKLENVTLTVRNLQDGEYTVEYWDPLQGTKTAAAAATVTGGKLSLNLPPVAQDLAGKVRKK